MHLNGNTWMLTYTGKRVELLDPDPATICIEDIAWGLAGTPRFTAHTSRHLSVLEHSINVAWLVDQMGGDVNAQMLGLMHDAHEAYLGDIGTPLKRALVRKTAELGACDDALLLLALDFDLAIQKALGLPLMNAVSGELVKEADRWAMAYERDALMPPHPDWTFDMSKAPGKVLVPRIVPLLTRATMVEVFTSNYEKLKAAVAKQQVVAAE